MTKNALRVLAIIILLALAVFFRPFLRATQAQLTPSAFSALGEAYPALVQEGVPLGHAVRLTLSNETPTTQRYVWVAIQKTKQVATGTLRLLPGASTTFAVPTTGATPGTLKVQLRHSALYVTVPLRPVKS